MLIKKRIARVISDKYSGWENRSGKAIPRLKPGHYRIEEDLSIGGDAPKDLIRVYESGKCSKANPKSWTRYIAKSSRKWYPNECINEYLLTRLGTVFGLQMAECRLLRVRGQVRFLSKYFLSKNEELVHGADLYAGYMEDPNFVKDVEIHKAEGDIFTVQVTKEALTKMYGIQNGEDIFLDYCWMLVLDAWHGNNDRHFYILQLGSS